MSYEIDLLLFSAILPRCSFSYQVFSLFLNLRVSKLQLGVRPFALTTGL